MSQAQKGLGKVNAKQDEQKKRRSDDSQALLHVRSADWDNLSGNLTIVDENAS